MGCLRLVLGDQLSRQIAALDGLDPARDVVMLAELMAECTYAPHHRQKIALVLAAMRHFAAALRADGITVRYIALDDPDNSGDLTGEVQRACADIEPERLIVTAPGEFRVLTLMQGLATACGVPCEIREDRRFLCSIDEFTAWARGRSQLRMEFFYREMRRKHRLLMDGDAPLGGRWNFDADNRNGCPPDLSVPVPRRSEPDALTRAVLDLVTERFPNHVGSLTTFAYPVTAAAAEEQFADFLRTRLPQFGDWQDAMSADAPFMFHALVSAPLNLGLLDPLEMCRRVEQEYHAGRAPLNAVEGFIRQILGWREFIRGIYWLHMPHYASLNALDAHRRLPGFYWTGDTAMRCMAAAIGQTLDYAYAHHIQRLMITGNFALLAGIDPDQVDQWYLAVYADAYEWVEMPNTRGMALHADGGIVGSKPYAASGAYINRMSNYCRGCAYDVKQATGARACPFNALYWDFIARHAERFAQNPRMAMPVRSWYKMTAEKQSALRGRAAELLTLIDQGTKL
ncbi:MAG TPA: cryptochrome/photolyase family protein [Acidiphilium sp.]|nr:MAG: cryptochrome/photolyase family protein [Acidiphilium sp. 21-60-14]OYV90717.1 MAG: cryptochrome/photolyase family protein [Acidiphilium sp. 37-60-79]OZB40060.1 MAG: cryptochrome/photolyase family protein [Acidiphilium sp. 34-60-192]HQT89025.1 cryptochrome/photolyase family protein [Acidiphilium sp.]HQU24122.1 cryptochrome/photolyase family protein [Acidiphilium sp.]